METVIRILALLICRRRFLIDIKLSVVLRQLLPEASFDIFLAYVSRIVITMWQA